ncbi:hypothetical protein PVAP13_3NG204300 [Panicum virgatum]|uniref:F-box protein At3g26010-like beta-propeller domain-containing protein n=1 Tax=Panicum virgatum TaxID=38727 RepID=A0A8T0UJL7_PANVG|nr:hypothetical protein PVAP13_3NG204300 [Panicum virgatum]
MAMKASRLMVNEDIPDEAICYNIFPCLPFKLLTGNTKFASIQATLCPSSPALINIGRLDEESSRYSLDVLSSTPNIVGVPSSRLEFLGCPINKGHFRLLASSNGLLCICYTSFHIGPLTPPPIIFIANPATQQAQPIPGAPQHLFKNGKFMIVQAQPFASSNDTLTKFCFVTFSSDTGRWVMSDTFINKNIKQVRPNKVVYASGILYWDCQEDLLWYDITRGITGSTKMPWKVQESNSEEWERHTIDASNNGMLMCTTIDKNGLAMHQLVTIGDHYWELKHQKGWKDIVEMGGEAFQFCYSMKLRNGWQSKFCERWFVQPLGLESERWIYLGILRYDIATGKVDNIGKEWGNLWGMYCVFGYRNSMAALPPINVPILQDGIYDGKSRGCVCAIKDNKE